MDGENLQFPNLPFNCLHQYSLMAEYNLVMTFHPPGVYLLPTLNCHNSWDGIISIRRGPYSGGVFAFNVQIPEDFPCMESPKIYLPCEFYHPNVKSKTGEVDLGSEFVKWTPGVSRIYHILNHLLYILSDPIADINFCKQPDIFEKHVKSYVEQNSLWSSTDSNHPQFAVPARPISVLGWQNDSFVAKVREKISTSAQPFKNCPCCSDANCRGYSWVDPAKMILFSPDRLCNRKSS